jgi:hypothetical protein
VKKNQVWLFFIEGAKAQIRRHSRLDGRHMQEMAVAGYSQAGQTPTFLLSLLDSPAKRDLY